MSLTKLQPGASPVSTNESPVQRGPVDVRRDRARPSLRTRLVALDAGAVLAGWLAVAALLYDVPPAAVLARGVPLVLLAIALQWSWRLYQARVCDLRSVEVLRTAYTSALLGLVAHLVDAVPGVGAGPSIATALATFATLALGRAGFRLWLRRRRRAGQFTRRVVILGTDRTAADLARRFRQHPEHGYRICGVVGNPAPWQRADARIPWLGDIDTIVRLVRDYRPDGAIVVANALDPAQVADAVEELQRLGVHVQLSAGLQRLSPDRLRVQPLGFEPMLYVEPTGLAGWQRLLKRGLDLVLATALLVLTAPLLLAGGVAVRLQDGGPVLFRQTRIGHGGRPFELLKLRTMVPDAESQRHELEHHNERSGPLFKISRDPRVTRVGRILRNTSIDELPQLVNVVRGSMSLVGPRPPLPEEVAHFDEKLLARFQTPPGITGLWQVEARDEAAFDLYRRLDLYYVENWSLGLDLVILLSTVTAVAGRALRAATGVGGHG